MHRLRLTPLLLIAALALPFPARAWDGSIPDSTRATRSPNVVRSQAPPRRPTHGKDGLRLGAIAGGVVGGTGAVFLGLLVDALCEGGNCEDATATTYVELGVIGTAVGVLSGGFFGWIIGSTIPAGEPPPSWEGTRAATGGHWPPIASFTVQPGLGTLTARPGHATSLSLRATLLAHVDRRIAIGPEFTHVGFAGGMDALAGAVYLGDRTRRLSPYLVADLGSYHWARGVHDVDVDVLGAGIGAGLLWVPAPGRARFGIEGRYHWTPQNIEDGAGYRFVEVGATAGWSW
jgi:hypothetical protein